MEVALGTAFDAALFVVATAVVGAGGDVPAVVVVVSDAAADQNPGDGVKAAEVYLVVVVEPAVVDVVGVEPPGHG